MRQFLSANIRRLVMLTVFLSVLPPLVILAFLDMERYGEVESDAYRRALKSVESIAERQGLITQNTLTLLSSLRKVISLKTYDPESNTGVFRRIVSRYPLFDNIFIISPTGQILSSAAPVPPGVSFAGTELLAEALASPDGCVYSSMKSRFSGEPVMQYVLPLTDSLGHAYAFMGAELRLRFFDSVFIGEYIPPGANCYVISGEGTLLMSATPSPPFKLGTSYDSPLWDAMRKSSERSATRRYFKDGIEYLSAYSSLHLPGMEAPYLYVVMGMPVQSALNVPESFMRRDASLLGGAALFALVAGLLLCHTGFGRPLGKLLNITKRLTGGDLTARVAGQGGLKGEFAELGDEFDAMAEALEARNEGLEKERETALRSTRAKSEFLANMSHEIRTPMNAIIGMAHLVNKTELTESQRAQVDKIRSAADDLLLLINNILDFSKIEAGKMQSETIPFHMGRLLNAVRNGTLAFAEECGSRLVTNIPASAPAQLLGDPTRLGQALSILLHEAILHSPGRPVEMSCLVERTEQDSNLIRFTSTVSGVCLLPGLLDEISLCFVGHGAQMTALNNRELSLMLAGSILRLLGGRAEVDNEPEGFRISALVRLGIPASRFEDQVLRFDGERVLVLDANAHARASFRSLLEIYNLRVEEAASLDQAVTLLTTADKNDNPFAIVIAEMPPASTDPIPYLEKLKLGVNLSRPPLLILSTAKDTSTLVHNLASSGIDAFLPRPVNESMLVDTLSGLIRGRHATTGTQYGPHGEKEGKEAPDLSGLTVLLVEDNLVNQEIATEVLADAGVTVITADNGVKAVEKCRKRPLPFSIILMDLEMPVMGGKEATKAIRNDLGLSPLALPILAMTAHNSPEEVSSCLAAGMNDHTMKPISVGELLATLQRWLPPKLTPEAREQLSALRDILLESHPRDPKVGTIMETLTPYLHEGRAALLRESLRAGDVSASLRDLHVLLSLTGGAKQSRQGG